MKLYTEEQVMEAIKSGFTLAMLTDGGLKEHQKEFIETLTPIELPSDEEIEDKGKWVFNDAGHTIYTHYNTVPSWVAGAKWMRDKIKGGKQ